MCGMEEITLGKLIQKVNERSRFNKGELLYTNDGKKYYIRQDHKTKEIVFEPVIPTMRCAYWIHLNSTVLLELNENGLLNTSRRDGLGIIEETRKAE
jgi:hypothetical protein